MKTDELIAQLSEAPQPVPRHAALQMLVSGLVPGALIAFVLVWGIFGFRHDLRTAIIDWPYWAKFFYSLTIAVTGFVLVKRLSHPGYHAGRRALILVLPFVLLALGAIWQWSSAPPEAHHKMMFGHSALICPWLIVGFSLPVMTGIFWAMRKLAPTDPAAGAAAGLFAGAVGAWIYGFACNEWSMVFVALWYTAGILLTAAIGYLSGRVLLRW